MAGREETKPRTKAVKTTSKPRTKTPRTKTARPARTITFNTNDHLSHTLHSRLPENRPLGAQFRFIGRLWVHLVKRDTKRFIAYLFDLLRQAWNFTLKALGTLSCVSMAVVIHGLFTLGLYVALYQSSRQLLAWMESSDLSFSPGMSAITGVLDRWDIKLTKIIAIPFWRWQEKSPFSNMPDVFTWSRREVAVLGLARGAEWVMKGAWRGAYWVVEKVREWPFGGGVVVQGVAYGLCRRAAGRCLGVV